MKIIIEEYNLNLTLQEAENLYNQLKFLFDKKDPAPVPWTLPVTPSIPKKDYNPWKIPDYPTEPYIWYTTTKPTSHFASGLTTING